MGWSIDVQLHLHVAQALKEFTILHQPILITNQWALDHVAPTCNTGGRFQALSSVRTVMWTKFDVIRIIYQHEVR